MAREVARSSSRVARFNAVARSPLDLFRIRLRIHGSRAFCRAAGQTSRASDGERYGDLSATTVMAARAQGSSREQNRVQLVSKIITRVGGYQGSVPG
jgi:hypothetical protein